MMNVLEKDTFSHATIKGWIAGKLDGRPKSDTSEGFLDKQRQQASTVGLQK